MSSSFDLPEVDLLTTGTVGPPGQRVFFLQARHEGRVVSLRLEKTQVAGLCTYLDEMLADLPAVAVEPMAEDMALVEPVVPEWVVGSLGVSYDEDDDRFLLVAEELIEEADEASEAGEGASEGASEGARARIAATRAQVAALTRHGTAVVAAGRPPCPLCGAPLDPQGHLCVRLNGHRDLAT